MMLKSLKRPVWCIQLMQKFFVYKEHMALMTSPTLTNQYRAVQAVCSLQKGVYCIWRYTKSTEVKSCTYYGPWRIAQKQIQTCFHLHVNSCKEILNFKWLQSRISEIMLDCCIKSNNGWIARVEFLWDTGSEKRSLHQDSWWLCSRSQVL